MKTIYFMLTMVLFSFSANAIETTGVVTNEAGLAVPGVNVVIKSNPAFGTVTDINGHYRIKVANENVILVFTYIGYQTQEIKIAGRKVLDVILIEDVKALEEVVVVRHGRAKIKNAVSSVFRKKSAETTQGMKVRGASTTPSSSSYADAMYEEHNTEGYSPISENGFKEVGLNPLSTFSIDVDAASYSNMRRFINNGSTPPVDAVRIEEMINYFNYDYPQPEDKTPFSINTELAACPWNEDNYLLHVGLQGKKLDMEELPSSNIVFLLDVSGSMESPNKLPLLKSSLKMLVNNLRENDKVAIVVYAGNAGLVLPSTSGDNKQAIIEALDRLSAGGSTAGGQGLKLAYKVAAENFIEEGNNRIILATDGDFNVGVSSDGDMQRLIEKERERGIAISVLGFGMGNYQDSKMEIIADKGNGNYAYIDNIQEAKKVLVNEFGGTLFTIAKDVKFQLEFNPAEVAEYRLIGYENRLLNEEDFEDDTKDAGEMGAGHTVTALYEIVPVKKRTATSSLKYQETNLTEEALKSHDLVTLKLRYKDPKGFKSKLVEAVVKNDPVKSGATSDNFRYSAAVAQFGMLLRNSEFKGTATWKSTKQLAKSAKGDDEDGYRSEMIRLIDTASELNLEAAVR